MEKFLTNYIFSHTQHIKKVLLSGNLVYNGKVENLVYVLDEQKALDWWDKVEDYIILDKIERNFKGKDYDVIYPYVKFHIDTEGEDLQFKGTIDGEAAEAEDITRKYIKSVQSKVKTGIYDEIMFFLEQEILQEDSYSICKITVGEKEFVTATKLTFKAELEQDDDEEQFKPSSIAGQKTAKTPYSGDVKVDLSTYQEKAFDDKETEKYYNMLLTMEEASKGYVDMRNHTVVQKMSYNEYKEVPYKMGQDITCVLHHDTKEITDLTLEETACEHMRDEREYYVKHKNKKILASKFKPVVREVLERDEEGEAITEKIHIYGAYTHILRKMLRFTPLTWQYQYIMGESRINFLAGKRRAGKTRLVAYLICRQLYAQHQHIFQSERPSKTTYVSFKEEALKDVIDYIQTSTKKVTLLNVIRYVSNDRRLYLVDERVSKKGEGQTKHSEVVGICDFITGGGYQPGRGKASDYILIDESAYVPEAVFKNLMYIVTGEKAKILCCSTISVDTPANWFWKWLNSTEIDQVTDPMMFAMRVTIDDIDDFMMSEEEKEFEKKIAMTDITRYYAELYCMVPNVDEVFDITGIFTPLETRRTEIVKNVIVGYDPAKRTDYSGIIVGVHKYIPEIQKEKLHIVREEKIQGEYTTTQKKFLLDLKEDLMNEYKPQRAPMFIMDATQVGDAISEVFSRNGLCDYKVWYTTSRGNPVTDDYGVWKVGKGNLVEMAQVLLSEQKIKIDNSLDKLREEMLNFKKKHSQGKYIKYEAETGHDDLVNGLLLVSFLYGFFLGKIYSDKDKDTKDLSYLWDDIDPTTRLLKGTNIVDRRSAQERRNDKGNSHGYVF